MTTDILDRAVVSGGAVPGGVLLRHPVIVVTVPVYNEERFLAQTLETLRVQTYTDFAVLICDNASTDGTQAIAEGFCRRDDRFHLYRHPVNCGGAGNFNFARAATDSPLFMWLGGHDVLEPTFLERHVGALLADPDAALSYSHIGWIDERDRMVGTTVSPGLDRLPSVPILRFVASVRTIEWCAEINHPMRRSALQGTRFSHVWGNDYLTLAEVAFHGRFLCQPEVLYKFRQFDVRAMNYMERLTGDATKAPDIAELLGAFDAKLTELAPNRLIAALLRPVQRALLEHRFTPQRAGLLARGIALLQRARQALAR